MKPENLEPLLLDRALGELSPEVAELLEEHLVATPGAAQQAAALTATLELAQRADALPRTGVLRPLGVSRIQQAERHARWWIKAGELAKLAACVVLGLVLGQVIRLEPPKAPTPPAIATAASASVSQTEVKFWSLASLRTERQLRSARQDGRGRGYQLHWESPLKMPRLEEKP